MAAKVKLSRGDAIQFSDPAFREELGYWLGQGIFGHLKSELSKLIPVPDVYPMQTFRLGDRFKYAWKAVTILHPL